MPQKHRLTVAKGIKFVFTGRPNLFEHNSGDAKLAHKRGADPLGGTLKTGKYVVLGVGQTWGVQFVAFWLDFAFSRIHVSVP